MRCGYVAVGCGYCVVDVIAAERFLCRSTDRDLWLSTRGMGVTATMVARAATPAGFEKVADEIRHPVDVQPNAVMAWGSYREAEIMRRVKLEFGIMPNDWLIAKDSGLSRWMMATPDGLSLDHSLVAEVKTSGKPLDKIPAHYYRQCQWQLWVTDAERCLFAYELRLDGPDGFVPGLDIVAQWVDRDEKVISELVSVAERLQMVNVYESWIGEDDE